MRNNFRSFSCNAAPYFQLKKLFHIYLFIVFVLNNIRKSCAPFMEILSSNDKYLNGKILPRNPLPIQEKKIPLKMYVHFPIAITICKHWSKFVTCSPSPGDCEGVSRP